jgi:hypothetical protein
LFSVDNLLFLNLYMVTNSIVKKER